MSCLVLWQSVVLGTNIFITLLGYDSYTLPILVTVGVLFMLLVFLGCFICFCHQGICAICLGCFSFLANLWWVAFIVFGAIFTYFYTLMKGLLTDMCESTADGFDDIRTAFSDIYTIADDALTTGCGCDSNTPSPQFCLSELEQILTDLGVSLFDSADTFTDQERADYNEANPDKPNLPASKDLFLL